MRKSHHVNSTVSRFRYNGHEELRYSLFFFILFTMTGLDPNDESILQETWQRRSLQHEHLQSHERDQDHFEFRHLPLLAMTVLAAGYVVFQKIYRCIRPLPAFEATDGDTVVDEEEAPEDDDDDDLNDKQPRNEMEAENKEEETHTDESTLTEEGAVSSSDTGSSA